MVEDLTSAEDPMRELREAVETVRTLTTLEPRVGIILGTGLGALVEDMDVQSSIAYGELPGFPLSTVESHEGRLLLGTLDGVPVAAMQGRAHRYEGYTYRQIVFPVRVLGLLGAEVLVISAATGGMNPLMKRGDLVLLDDHINLQNGNPLVGPNLDELGPRFPDMSEPYDRELQALAREVALEEGIDLQRGVYVAVTGPNLETRAEYRMLRSVGADVVGMSTVPEVIAARHMGMRVMAVTIITDECFPDALEPVELEEVIRTAQEAEPKLTTLIRKVVGRL